MTKITINTGNTKISKQQLKTISTVSTLILEGKIDQAQIFLNTINDYTPFRSVNNIHNQLYKDVSLESDEHKKRSIWDKDIGEFQNSPEWIQNFFEKSFNSVEKHKIKNINITKNSSIASIGSCFATNFSKHLRKIGFQNVQTLRVEEAVNSPKLIDLYLNPEKIDDSDRESWNERFSVSSQNVLTSIKNLDLLILTFGVGFDFLDGNNKLVINTDNISERVRKNEIHLKSSPVDQQAKYIESCLHKISEINPNLPVFITLSPVPLSGFHGAHHVAIANTISKSSLSLAIHKAKENTPFFYLPIYEIVTSLSELVTQKPVWGEDGTTRHPKSDLVEKICRSFITYITS
tara:strand:+ start:3007 stop:4050 length:1044 start_codon:yes stop_codon:yes gene_type:complete